MSNDRQIAIRFALTEATAEDLNAIQMAIQERREVLSRINRRAMRVGQAVTFKHRGKVYSGTLRSIKLKKAVVSTLTVDYNVPLNMLEAA